MDISFGFETLQGALIGVVFGLAAFLITRLPKYQWTFASILCVLITPLALLPIWLSYGDLGISDWDYYFSMHTNLRNSIVEFHQFPLWNPYTCGGTSALGDPEFPVFSPLFLLELLFGTPAGLRLSVYVSTAVGALGMLHLSRKLKIGVLGGLVASLGMAFGSVNLLEFVEGHQNILAAMYIPWVLYAWYSAYTTSGKRRTLSLVTLAILLALIFFQGGLYLLMYMTGVFIVLPFLVRYPKKAISLTFISGCIALGLAAVKLAPVAYWVQQFQDKAYASSTYTLANLDDILLGRILYGPENIIPDQGSGWHEYGAYIGPVILVLALIGFLFQWKNRIARGLLIAAILATLVSSIGPILKPMFDQLPFIPRSNISRVILFAVIPLSLLAGFGIDGIEKKSRLMRIFALLLLTLASIDIMSLAYPLSSQAFVLPHVAKAVPPAPSPIAYNPFDYKIRHNGVDYTRAYDSTLAGYGNMSYCSVLGPDPAISLISDPDAKYVSFPDNRDATFSILSWTPSRVSVTVSSPTASAAVINTNYADGWYVNGKPAKNIANKVGIDIPVGTSELTFQYVPRGMWAGILITSLTLLSSIGWIVKKILLLVTIIK